MLFASVLLLISFQIGDGREPPADSVLEQLFLGLDARAAAASDFCISWDYVHEQYTIPDPTPARKGGGGSYADRVHARAKNPLKGAVRKPQQFCEGRARYYANKGWFWFHSDVVDEWVDGAASAIGVRDAIGFDGEHYWEVLTSKPGSKLPLDDFTGDDLTEADWLPEGSVGTSAPVGGRLEAMRQISGFSFRPGFMALPYVSSENKSVSVTGYLRELQRRGVELRLKQADGFIHVTYDVPDKRDPDQIGGYMTISFNMNQLAAVERLSYIGKSPVGDLPTADFIIENEEIRPGLWLPKKILWGDWLNTRVDVIRLSNYALKPSCSPADFRVSFPIGTRITDFRNSLTFVASAGMVDEDRAVREFAALHLGDFEPLRELGREKSTSWLKVASSAFGLLLLLGFFVYWLRSRQQAATFFLAVCIPATSLIADDSAVPPEILDWSPSLGWCHGGGPLAKRSYVTTCGIRVTSLVLTAFGRDYSPAALTRHLKPKSEGNSLLQLRDTFSAFGIHAEARKKMSWKTLSGSLHMGQMAVVRIPPIHIPGGHFVAAYKNDTGDLMYVDAPYSAYPMQLKEEEQYLSEELVVLVLTCKGTVSVDVQCPSLVEIEPRSGSWRSRAEVSFRVRNQGDGPLWLADIPSSCGCLKVKEQPSFLEPGSAHAITVSIDPLSFGVGRRRKELKLNFGNGVTKTVLIEGEFQPARSEASVRKLAPLRMSLPAEFTMDDFPIRNATVGLGDTVLDRIDVVVGKDWCLVQEANGGTVDCSIQLPHELAMRVRAGENLKARIEGSKDGRLLAECVVEVNLDSDAIGIDQSAVEAKSGQCTFSGSISAKSAAGWQIECPQDFDGAFDGTVGKNGQWQLILSPEHPLTRPTPVRVRFTHAQYLEMTIVCVLLPSAT